MMAEFQEVMREWVRARKAIASNSDEENVLSVYPLEAYNDSLIASIEKNVMQWAEEHPEPIYPCWIDWLTDIGLIIKTGDHYGFNFTAALNQIPADIAERLGIEPKEGIA